MKAAIKNALLTFGYEIKKTGRPPRSIPDAELYRPFFSPWLSTEFGRHYARAARRSLVPRDRCYVLYTLALQTLRIPGDLWECGVYKGGTASMLAALLREQGSDKTLHLFDTFEGMPQTDAERDIHREGDFADTSLENVKAYVGEGHVAFHKGFMPDTFKGLESEKIAFAHIDVDIYRSILDCLEFIWPRLSPGGIIIFDDYGAPTCPGARQAVDEFFKDKPEEPLCLPNCQAIIFAGVAR